MPGHTRAADVVLPTRWPATAPRQQGIGQACQARSQSSGRTAAAAQAPNAVESHSEERVAVAGGVVSRPDPV